MNESATKLFPKNITNFILIQCGVPKKGHICPYQPKIKRRPDEPAPELKNASTQVEMDEFLVVRRLNLEIQGYPETYCNQLHNNVGAESVPHPYAPMNRTASSTAGPPLHGNLPPHMMQGMRNGSSMIGGGRASPTVNNGSPRSVHSAPYGNVPLQQQSSSSPPSSSSSMHPGTKKSTRVPMTTQTTTGTGMEGGGPGGADSGGPSDNSNRPSPSSNYGTMDHDKPPMTNNGEMDYKLTNPSVTTAVEATGQ